MVPEQAFTKLKSELQYYNLQEVAEVSGVSDQTLRNWLSDDPKRCPRFPTVQNFIKVCQTLQLNIDITIR
jgi:transcriptional regulator with XRE-family HTH domain